VLTWDTSFGRLVVKSLEAKWDLQGFDFVRNELDSLRVRVVYSSIAIGGPNNIINVIYTSITKKSTPSCHHQSPRLTQPRADESAPNI
jgi:hypothetical protein